MDGAGFVAASLARARQAEYLAWATAEVDPGDVVSILAACERKARDEEFDFDPATVTPASLRSVLDDIANFVDTTDFVVLYLLNLWYRDRATLPAATRDAVERALLGFKYWYTEPTPAGIVDHKWYWSENHRLIFHVDEFLAGQAFPTATFTNDGRAGAEHRDEARGRILTWMQEKVRFGFTEWHSNVYYQKDLTPLLSLVELADDRELVERASMLLDLVLLDIALHLQRGTFGATHGRSYMKDKSVATDEETFALAKLLFDDTSEPYPRRSDAGATLFARASTYALPAVLAQIATSDEPFVDREHMGIPLDPLAPVDDDLAAPYGYAFDDPANVPFWWERGAHATWQLIATTVAALDRHDLWDSEFFRSFKPLRDAVGNDPATLRDLAQALASVLGFGLLTEVDTYTYRSADVMLSTAQDHRPGGFSAQVHSWQATLDERALVFTTHPKHEPLPDVAWPDEDGYWTGTGSLPRSAQHRTVAIHLYAPQFERPGPPFEAFSYLDFTHAYFPQEHFDEVVRDGHWTFGHRGDGCVGLWSQRPVEWRSHDPARFFTHGLTEPFDLIASGGAENVWIVEVGDANRWQSFAAFRTALRAARVEVRGNDVRYESPTEGGMTFGWDAPLRVDGNEIELHHRLRFDNPFVTAEFGATRYEIATADASLVLDFERTERRAGQPGAGSGSRRG